MTWQHIDNLLTRAERIVPRSLWASRLFGLTIGAALGIPLWAQTVNGWTLDGRREPLAYRVSVAWLIWKARYWWDWSKEAA
jgi:hypothetical protein